MRVPDEERLEQLLEKRSRLADELQARTDKLNEDLRKVRNRLSKRERKQRTRRLILYGAWVQRNIKIDAQLKARVRGDLDKVTPRAADRKLLGLAPLPSPDTEPIPGFCPAKLPDQTWGARFEDDPAALPAELVGLRIRIKAKSSGNTWDGTVTETINKADGSILYRYADKADTP